MEEPKESSASKPEERRVTEDGKPPAPEAEKREYGQKMRDKLSVRKTRRRIKR